MKKRAWSLWYSELGLHQLVSPQTCFLPRWLTQLYQACGVRGLEDVISRASVDSSIKWNIHSEPDASLMLQKVNRFIPNWSANRAIHTAAQVPARSQILRPGSYLLIFAIGWTFSSVIHSSDFDSLPGPFIDTQTPDTSDFIPDTSWFWLTFSPNSPFPFIHHFAPLIILIDTVIANTKVFRDDIRQLTKISYNVYVH